MSPKKHILDAGVKQAKEDGKKIDSLPVDLQALQKADRVLGRATKVTADQLKPSPVKKNPLHSVLTTLPVIMLLAGLWFYYAGEKKQRNGEPVIAEMQLVQGLFAGLSEQGQSANSQRIVWIKTTDKLRGGRLQLQQYKALQQLSDEQPLDVWLAPRVAGSSTLWVVKVVSLGSVLIDQVN